MQTGQQLPYAEVQLRMQEFTTGQINLNKFRRGLIGPKRSNETYFYPKSAHFYIVWMDIALNKRFFHYHSRTICIYLVDLATLHHAASSHHLVVDKTFQRMDFLGREVSYIRFCHGCKYIFDHSTTIVHYDCNYFCPTENTKIIFDQVIWGQPGINYLVDAIFALWAALLVRRKLVFERTGQKWTSFNRRTHFWSYWATITCRTTFSWCWLLNTILKLSCEKIKSGSFEVKKDQYSFGKGSFQVINRSLEVTEGRKSIPLDKFCIFHDWIWFLLFRNDQHMFPFYTDLLFLAKNFSRFN